MSRNALSKLESLSLSLTILFQSITYFSEPLKTTSQPTNSDKFAMVRGTLLLLQRHNLERLLVDLPVENGRLMLLPMSMTMRERTSYSQLTSGKSILSPVCSTECTTIPITVQLSEEVMTSTSVTILPRPKTQVTAKLDTASTWMESTGPIRLPDMPSFQELQPTIMSSLWNGKSINFNSFDQLEKYEFITCRINNKLSFWYFWSGMGCSVIEESAFLWLFTNFIHHFGNT